MKMLLLAFRFLIGFLCLSGSFFLGLVSSYELVRLSMWLLLMTFGISGLFLVFGRQRLSSFSMITVWAYFFLDVSVRGFNRLYFGFRPDPVDFFTTVFNTSTQEAYNFFCGNWHSLIISVVFYCLALVLLVFIERKLRHRFNAGTTGQSRLSQKVIFGFICFLFIVLHALSAMRRESPITFWPNQYREYQNRAKELERLRKNRNIHQNVFQSRYAGKEANRTLVLVIGESANRNNMSVYGYPRDTTPEMNRMQDRITVFRDVISASYMTAPSLSMALTPANRQDRDGWKALPDVITIAKRAGYKTFWLSNQNATDGLLTLIAEGADVHHFCNHGSVISESPYDDILLKPYKEALNDPAPLKLIVVHLLGSHFHYKFRYPEKYARFSSNDDEVAVEMKKAGRPDWMITKRNEYDNSILFTDALWSQLAQELFSGVGGKDSAKGSALLYFSDHGQEVGHYRDHGGPSKSDKSGWEVPMVLMTTDRQVVPKSDLSSVHTRWTDSNRHCWDFFISKRLFIMLPTMF